MKKFLSILLVLSILLTMLPVYASAEVPEGDCGDTCNWSLDTETGTLYIQGTGEIGYQYSGTLQPWYPYRDSITEVVIAEGITAIPRYTFEYLRKAQTIRLPDTLEYLACNAFNSCEALNNLVIPASVVEFLNTDNFNRCTALTDIWYMGTRAQWEQIKGYANAEYYEEHTIHCLTYHEDSLTCPAHGKQPYYAYDGTSNTVRYDADLNRISCDTCGLASSGTCGENAFWSFNEATGRLTIRGTGAMTDYNRDHPASWKALPIKAVTVEEGITTIGREAFHGQTTLTQVSLPQGLTSLGYFAFGRCSSLANIKLPDTLTTMFPSALEGTALYTVHIPASVAYIGEYAFLDCPSLQYIYFEGDVPFCLQCDVTSLDSPLTGHVSQIFYGCKATVYYPVHNETWTTDVRDAFCQANNSTYTQLSFTGNHEWSDATCTEAQTCTVCGVVLGQPLGHRGSWTTLSQPTCQHTGEKQFVCTVCGHTETEIIPIVDHAPVDLPAVAPTCTKPGKTAGQECDFCGLDLEGLEEVPATGHTGSWTILSQPTCQRTGEKQFICTVCGHTETEIIPIVDHKPVDLPAVAPTCTKPGKTAGQECDFCGLDLEGLEEVPATGHQTVIEPAVAPTCTTAGFTEGRYCSVCGEVFARQETVAATGHTAGDPVTENRMEATCTAASSYESVTSCTACGKELSRRTVLLEKLPHKETTVAGQAPTCTENGLTEGKCCTVCGQMTVARQPISAVGHTDADRNYRCDICGEKLCTSHRVEVLSGYAPTCTEAGLTDGTRCGICGEILSAQQELAPLGHSPETNFGKAPTCTQDGLTESIRCSICGTMLEEPTVIPAKGHSVVIHKAHAATCTEPGLTEGRHCSECGEVLTKQEVIPAKGHREGEIRIENRVHATCAKEGSYQQIVFCADCGSEISRKTFVLEKLPHTKVTHNGFAPTCTESGLTEGSKCGICGEVLTIRQTVPATGHTPETIPGQTPTCTEAGFTEGRRCGVCGETLTEQSMLPATGHVIQTLPGKAPTCTEPGLTEGSSCSVCRQILIKQGSIPAIGHTNKTLPATAPTCTATGLSEGKQCTVCNMITVKQEVIPARGHSFGGWESSGKPNEEHRVCSSCGLTETRSASSLRFSLSSTSGLPGTTVTVTLSLENNPGIIGARLALHYDADKLELIGHKDLNLLRGGQFGNDLSANPFMLVWEDPLATQNNTASGDLLSLTFRIRENFSSGSTEIRLTAQAKDIYDKDIVPVGFSTQNSTVTIRSYNIGDTNLDGKVSLMDATYLRRHLAGWKGYDVRATEADTNGDGEVSLADATVLRRYLAGWSGVVLGQPAPAALQLQEDAVFGLFRCSSITGQAGDTVTVDVILEDNPGIIAALLTIGYDPQKLRLTAAEDTGLLAGHMFGNDLSAMPYALSWEDPLCQQNNTGNGTIASLTFTILEDCLPGETAVTIGFDDSNVYNYDLNPTPFLTQAGTVTVEKEAIPAVMEPVQIEEKKVTLHIESKKELTSVQIWCAVYDDLGQFVDVVLKEVTIPAGASDQTVELPAALQDDQWVRAFLLDGSHAPCSEAVDNKN